VSSWATALKTYFTDADARRVEESAQFFETKTGVGRHIVPSLLRDHFFPVPGMREIQDFFLQANWSFTPNMIQQYGQLCISHVSTGGPIKTPTPLRHIGRALEENTLINNVFTANGRKVPRKVIAKLIDRLVANQTTAVDNSVLKRLKMSPYAAWVTWDFDSSGYEDPFAFSAPLCADEIRANLGLSMESFGQRIILLVYSSADAPSIVRPTCADAGLFLRFEPPPADFDLHGLTKPWEEMPFKKKRSNPPDFRPRPEALHGPIAFPDNLRTRRPAARR
jgi:hypothetical protein